MLSKPKSQGLIQVYTGNGKGKTTASLGTAIRAVAEGMKVAIVYFDKGGTHYAERKILESRFKGEIDFFSTGLDRIDPKTGRFRFGVMQEDKDEAERGLALVQKIFLENNHQLVILDEINTTVTLGMLEEKKVLAIIKQKPEVTELILTGRTAPESFRELADLLSEVTLVKHYFYQGVPARSGIDF